MAKPIRLDKFLSEMKLGTRSQVKERIRKGAVTVNGTVCRESDAKIDPDADEIFFAGTPVSYTEWEYYMLNKPSGVISATEDSRHKTVLDLIDAKRNDLFPVGRLDIDTEGLLLITNDGKLAHELLAPKKHVDKTYFARVEGNLSKQAEMLVKEGLVLKDGTTALPGTLVIHSVQPVSMKDENTEDEISEEPSRMIYEYETTITIHEGKFHQVKRMFEALGGQVVFLKRLSMGTLVLDPALEPGMYRPLSKTELARLKNREQETEKETGEQECYRE